MDSFPASGLDGAQGHGLAISACVIAQTYLDLLPQVALQDRLVLLGMTFLPFVL